MNSRFKYRIIAVNLAFGVALFCYSSWKRTADDYGLLDWTDRAKVTRIALQNNNTAMQNAVLASLKVGQQKLILAYSNIYGNVFNLSSIGRTAREQKYSPNPLEQCEYKCSWSTDKRDMQKSDAVLFHLYNNLNNKDFVIDFLPKREAARQWWIFMAREPQAFYYPEQLARLDGLFNLTMTFQYDSDIVIPYGSYWPLTNTRSIPDYFIGKDKLAAWVASNCKTSSRREEFVKELQKHMHIDIYGKCGNLTTSTDSVNGFRAIIAKQYKFYIAFENSDCDDYISEKFWNSLSIGIIPVVRGHRINYKKLAPPNSYIQAETFMSAQQLAEYLKRVAGNATLYNSYFAWKRHYNAGYKFFTTNSRWMCDLCKKVHTSPAKTVKISEFFSEDTRCFTYLDQTGRNRDGEHVEDINRH